MTIKNEWTEVQIEDQDEYSKKHTSPATNIEVKAAPGANQRYILDMISANGTANGTLQIKDSDGTDIDGYFFAFPANGGFGMDGKHLKQIPKGKGFKYSTTGGGSHAVMFKFHLREE